MDSSACLELAFDASEVSTLDVSEREQHGGSMRVNTWIGKVGLVAGGTVGNVFGGVVDVVHGDW